MFVIKYRKLFFTISGLLVLASIISIFTFGIKLGTDFTGGTIMEVEYAVKAPGTNLVKEKLATLNLGNIALQNSGDRGFLIRLPAIDEAGRSKINQALSALGDKTNQLTEKRFSSIGPALGQELYRKGLIAVIIVVLLIILYIAFVFRKVSVVGGTKHATVSSWKYGIIAVLALIHDTLIPTGVISFLGYYYGVEIDALFITALLTILGLSVNDTIVIFDRIREKLKERNNEPFEETVGRSLSETYSRSFNTSLTVILVLLALVFYGPATTKIFALMLTIGMVVGTYSSIFIAAPLLVVWNNRQQKN